MDSRRSYCLFFQSFCSCLESCCQAINESTWMRRTLATICIILLGTVNVIDAVNSQCFSHRAIKPFLSDILRSPPDNLRKLLHHGRDRPCVSVSLVFQLLCGTNPDSGFSTCLPLLLVQVIPDDGAHQRALCN